MGAEKEFTVARKSSLKRENSDYNQKEASLELHGAKGNAEAISVLQILCKTDMVPWR